MEILDGAEARPLSKNIQESVSIGLFLVINRFTSIAKATYEKSTIGIARNDTQ